MGEALDHAYALEWRTLELDPDDAALADAAMTLTGRWGDAAVSSEGRYSAFEYGANPTGSHAFLVGYTGDPEEARGDARSFNRSVLSNRHPGLLDRNPADLTPPQAREERLRTQAAALEANRRRTTA